MQFITVAEGRSSCPWLDSHRFVGEVPSQRALLEEGYAGVDAMYELVSRLRGAAGK